MTKLAVVPQPSLAELEMVIPDVGLIASNLSAAGRANGKSVSAPHLEGAITQIQYQSINTGSPSLTINLIDPAWNLLDSGFFDTDKDGILDRIEIVYPPPDETGIDYRWTLTQVAPQSDHTIQLTFMNSYADALTRINPKATPKLAPLKAQRGQVTRAQFLKMLAEKVPGLEFYCQQLDVKQPIVGLVQQSAKSSIKQPAGKGDKKVGIGANSGTLTCKGKPLTSTQLDIVNTALAVANQLRAPTAAIEAMMYAAMGESTIAVASGGGVWQDLSSPDPSNVAAEAKAFLTGQYGFHVKGVGGHGAIWAAGQGMPVWQIANAVESNALYNSTGADSYAGQWNGGQAEGLKEAAAIVAAGGGALTGAGSVTTTTITVEPYYFTVGTSDNPNESYWDAMQRLAQEVKWPLILVGNRMYYDPEPHLARAVPAAHIRRDSPELSDWNYVWDARAICTQMNLSLFCGPFDFAAGDVVTLENFGTATTASTVKLPGRWLVAEVDRDRASLVSQFTLKQPALPSREPAPQVQTSTSTSTVNAAAGGGTPGTPGAAYAAAKALSDLKLHYSQTVRTLVRSPKAGSACYDCSASVSHVLLAAGFRLPGSGSGVAPTWGDWAPTSFAYLAGQGGLVSGEGDQMTIWCITSGEGHIFLEFKVDGLPHSQGNTVPVSGSPNPAGFSLESWDGAGGGGWAGPHPLQGLQGYALHYPGT